MCFLLTILSWPYLFNTLFPSGLLTPNRNVDQDPGHHTCPRLRPIRQLESSHTFFLEGSFVHTTPEGQWFVRVLKKCLEGRGRTICASWVHCYKAFVHHELLSFQRSHCEESPDFKFPSISALFVLL